MAIGSAGEARAGDDADSTAIASPRVREGYAYWRGLAVGRLPSRAMIDPTAIPRLLPHVIILGVRREPRDFFYRLVGTAVRDHMEHDPTGRWMSEIPFQKPPSMIWASVNRVVEERRPIVNCVPYVGPKRDFVVMESVQLPLAADGETVDMVLVFVDFRPAMTGA